MVRPTSFGFDEETAKSNSFQQHVTLSAAEVLARAAAEFDSAVSALRSHGIGVLVFEDAPTPPKPDAVFPNNWLSTWPDGRVYLYPMATEVRRRERSKVLLDQLRTEYQNVQVVDLTSTETAQKYLESTGVMIFDHEHKVVYGCISVRCDEALFRHHAEELGYKPVLVHAYDEQQVPIYHTNVLMGVQTSTAVVCLDAITNAAERQVLADTLAQTGHEVIAISQAQMNDFCGNVLELQNASGELFLVMSRTAYNAFTPEQRVALSKDKTLLALDIQTIETIGGGSARCMLAELFLTPRV